MTTTDDPMDLLARYAPTPGSLRAEWNGAVADDVLATIVGERASVASPEPVHEIPLRFVPTHAGPRRRPRILVPLAASVTALAIGAGVLLTALEFGGGSGGTQAGAPPVSTPFDPPAGLSDQALPDGDYSYLVDQQIDLDASGKALPGGSDAMIARNYVNTDGDIVSIRTGSQTGCTTFARDATGSGVAAPGEPSPTPAAEPGYVDFGSPSKAFFASLPTDVEQLDAYIRKHVEGSSSQDEAVFVAVGDALRTADGLASPKLRAAMVAVLSRTPGVTLHMDTTDYLGRPAIRADFVNQAIRPGEVHAYYFDPTTFQFLEEQDGHNSRSATYNGPSPAYTAPAPAGDDPDEIGGPGFVSVITTEKVVDALPPQAQHCPNG